MKKPTLSSIAPKSDFSALVKRTRILVIDDVETEFPFEILRREGYAIDYWKDAQELAKLETGYYDIIILDIGGVGRKLDAANEGAGLLNHIKSVNPSQIVIAYSGQSHHSNRIPFFKLADQYVPKPANVLTWKETIDDLIANKSTVAHYWTALRQILVAQGYGAKQVNRLEKALVLAAKTGEKPDASTLVATTLGAVDKVATIASITGKIIAICSAA
ncbi:MAG: hypothetical protein L0Y44_10215 [Phycisphaerales bacterium]|nr:hypothetical protein [Phycisphaerales bacterium]